MRSLLILGVGMYWAVQISIRPPPSSPRHTKGAATGSPDPSNQKRMTLLCFGERHQPVHVGCTRPLPICVGEFCLRDQGAREAKWVDRYIFDDLLDDGYDSALSGRSALFVENPMWDVRRGVPESMWRDYPFLARALVRRRQDDGSITTGTTDMAPGGFGNGNMLSGLKGTATYGVDVEKHMNLRTLIQKIRRILKNATSSASSDLLAPAPSSCGKHSKLKDIRDNVDNCNRGKHGAPGWGTACRLNTRRLEVDHFDARMVSGPLETLINPFPLLLRCYSFLDHFLGESCPGDGSDWVPSQHAKDVHARCLHYILGPASPLPEAEWKSSCEEFVEQTMESYLTSRYDESLKAYVPSQDDSTDVPATQALADITERGRPRQVTRLMKDMFRLAHAALREQIERTERCLGKAFVSAFMRLYCHFCINVYTRPQVRNAFHVLWVTGLGERWKGRMKANGKGMTQQDIEDQFYSPAAKPAFISFQHPYYTRSCMKHASRTARLVNVKSPLTDSITDIRMMLRMLELGTGGDCPRAVLYGGMAHTKNISRFFSFIADRGPRRLPTFCAARPGEPESPLCLCDAKDFDIVQRVITVVRSEGEAQEYQYPDPDQWVVPPNADQDLRDFRMVESARSLPAPSLHPHPHGDPSAR